MDSGTILKKLNLKPSRKVKRLNIMTPRLVNNQLIGSFRSMVKGRGIEFEGYKKYEPAHDDAKNIDWKASVRAGDTLVKTFKEERDINIMFLIDGGSNMVFSSHDKLKIEFALEIALSLAYNSILTGDRVGVLIHGEKLRKYVPLYSGKLQYHKICDAVSNTSYYGGPTNMLSSLKYLTRTLKRNSILFIVSDFIYPPENFKEALSMAALKFDTICLTVRDPRDMQMPTAEVGQVAIQHPMTGQVLVLDPTKIGDRYARMAKDQMEEVEAEIENSGASMLRIDTDENFLPKLINFFNTRTTKWK